MIDKFLKESKDLYDARGISLEISSFEKNPALNLKYTKEALHNVEDLSDNEIYEILKKSYPMLLKDIFERNDDTYLYILINTRLLDQFIRVLTNVELSYLEVIYCNRIVYDYLTTHTQRVEGTKRQLLSLAKVVNKKQIGSLQSIGIDQELAAALALSRNSSLKEDVCIKRLNLTMIMSSEDVMDAQTIIYIYETLFDSFGPVFINTMFDYYDKEMLHNISNDASEIYSNISLALCTILENLPSNLIRSILIGYSGDYNLTDKYDVRFPIRSIALSDYPRIHSVVDTLEKVEMVYVP